MAEPSKDEASTRAQQDEAYQRLMQQQQYEQLLAANGTALPANRPGAPAPPEIRDDTVNVPNLNFLMNPVGSTLTGTEQPTTPMSESALKEQASAAIPAVGGAVGSMVGGVTMGPPGIVIGGTLGGMGGSAIQQLIEKGWLSRREVMYSGAVEGVTSVAGEGIAKAAPLKRFRKWIVGNAEVGALADEAAFRDLAKRIEPQLLAKYPNDQELVREFVDELSLFAGQMSDSERIRVLENLERGSLVTGNRFEVKDRMQRDVMNRWADLVASDVAPLMDAGDIGVALAKSFEESRQTSIRVRDDLYSTIRARFRTLTTDEPGGKMIAKPGPLGTTIPERIPGEKSLAVVGRGTGNPSAGLVSIKGIGDVLGIENEVARQLGQTGIDTEGVQRLAANLKKIKDGKPLSFAVAQQIRSDLSEMSLRTKIVGPDGSVISTQPQFEAAADKVKGFLSERMKKAADELDAGYNATRAQLQKLADEGKLPEWAQIPPERSATRDLMEAADEYTRNSYSDLGTDGAIIRGLINGANNKLDAPATLKYFLKDGNPQRIEWLYSVVGKESKEADLIRSWHIHDLLNTKDLGTLRKTLYGPGSPAGDRMLEVLHGKERLDRYRRFFNAVERVGLPKRATGELTAQLVEVGKIGGIPGVAGSVLVFGPSTPAILGGAAIGTGGYIVGMKALSRWLANPKMAERLITAVSHTAGARERRAAFMRLFAELGKDEYLQIPETMTRDEYLQQRREVQALQ